MLGNLKRQVWKLRPLHANGFLQRLGGNPTLLDVGCGNDSPARIKGSRPDTFYVGLDVGDYNLSQGAQGLMDEYHVVPPDDFAAAIERMPGRFDAVMSSHNIEHCNEPDRVIAAMAAALKPGGRLYLSFPSEQSLTFPKRENTLNYHDDPTHQAMPRFDDIMARLRDAGLSIDHAHNQYQPWFYYGVGALLEPIHALRKKVDRHGFTWAYWGFETVIWARRPVVA